MSKLPKRGAGVNRDAWGIRAYLDGKGLKMADIARQVGLHNTVVEQTVHGWVNNRKVLRHLRFLGIPQNVLSLPEDMLVGDKDD